MNKGFTLVELLITIALIAVITVTMGVSISSMINRQEEKEFQQYVELIEESACTYAEKNNLPQVSSEVSIDTLISEGLLSKDITNPKTDKNIEYYGSDIIGIRWIDYERICNYAQPEGSTDEDGSEDDENPYVYASITNVEVMEVTETSIKVKPIVEVGTSKINKYYYSINNGDTYFSSNDDNYTFTGLVEATEYNIKVFVTDEKGYESNEYSLKQKTVTNLGGIIVNKDMTLNIDGYYKASWIRFESDNTLTLTGGGVLEVPSITSLNGTNAVGTASNGKNININLENVKLIVQTITSGYGGSATGEDGRDGVRNYGKQGVPGDDATETVRGGNGGTINFVIAKNSQLEVKTITSGNGDNATGGDGGNGSRGGNGEGGSSTGWRTGGDGGDGGNGSNSFGGSSGSIIFNNQGTLNINTLKTGNGGNATGGNGGDGGDRGSHYSLSHSSAYGGDGGDGGNATSGNSGSINFSGTGSNNISTTSTGSTGKTTPGSGGQGGSGDRRGSSGSSGSAISGIKGTISGI